MKLNFQISILFVLCLMVVITAQAQTDVNTPAPEPITPSAADTSNIATLAVVPSQQDAPPQQVPTVPVELRILQKVQEELKEKFRSDIYTPANIPSLFFSSTQQSLLNSARQGMTSSFADGDLDGLDGNDEVGGEGTVTSKPAITSIFLSGIVFNAKDNWTIWLNGARVTPQTLPKEIIDINVSQEFIELKWFDSATNQIFPVRLRPNQKFDFERKIFLPGQ